MEPYPRIFNYQRKKLQDQERLSCSSEDYIEYSKISIYLQDAVKVILDRREDKPLEVLSEYFSLALRGEHILLRDHAFISSSQYNRSCFMTQMASIFHSSPYYKVVTALDYHQCLCLLCSDFPRTLVAEAAKVLQPHPNYPSTRTDSFASTLSQEPVLFNKFDLEDLRLSVQLLFCYSEFMEKTKEIFLELTCGDYENGQVTISMLCSSLETLYKRKALNAYPPIELVYEGILTKAQKKMKMNPDEFYALEDVQGFMTGAGTISFYEFAFNLMKNLRLDKEISEISTGKIGKEDKLKEIALEETLQTEPMNQPGRRVKPKKKK